MEVNNLESSESKSVRDAIPEITAEEMLESVNNAIVAITSGGQSYKIGSRELTRANLKDLYKIKNDLTAQLNNNNSSHLFDGCVVGVFSGR
ncbi:MAG: peptidylprolyl isomerase [Catonella sp.]